MIVTLNPAQITLTADETRMHFSDPAFREYTHAIAGAITKYNGETRIIFVLHADGMTPSLFADYLNNLTCERPSE